MDLNTFLRVPGMAPLYWHFKWKAEPKRQPAARAENAVLKTRKEWEAARAEARELGLPLHNEPSKNWDSLIALRVILDHVKPDGRVLDAGSETYSAILPWLANYGYTNLVGNNLVFERPLKLGPITFEHGDITKMRFEDNSFDAITSMSVIEHNVPVSEFLKEAARVLKPGGVLVISTDYFDPQIDTKGHEAYGGPVKVYTADGIRAMLAEAKTYGLVPTSDMDFSCDEKCVTWSRFGLSYTFVCVTLRKA